MNKAKIPALMELMFYPGEIKTISRKIHHKSGRSGKETLERGLEGGRASACGYPGRTALRGRP